MAQEHGVKSFELANIELTANTYYNGIQVTTCLSNCVRIDFNYLPPEDGDNQIAMVHYLEWNNDCRQYYVHTKPVIEDNELHYQILEAFTK